MLGPEAVVEAIVLMLQRDLPRKLVKFRNRYGIVDGSLPDIDRFLRTEPQDVAIDKPPLIVVVEQESDSLEGPRRNTDDGKGGTTWKYRYTLTVIIYASGVSYEDTALRRKRYGLAVRECLLQRPGLGDPDPGEIVLVPEEIRETYSSVARDGDSAMIIAATAILIQYETQEWLQAYLPSTPGGTVSSDVGMP